MNKTEMNRHIQRLEGEVKHAQAVGLSRLQIIDSLKRRLSRVQLPWYRRAVIAVMTKLKGKKGSADK